MENDTLDSFEDTHGASENDVTPLSDVEIFTKIWTSPRMVFKYINAKEYSKFMYPLLILYGMNSILDQAFTRNMASSESMIYILGIGAVGGAVFGVFIGYIYAALLSWTGGWLSGDGNTQSILRIFAYATVPSIASLILTIPKMLLFENLIGGSGVNGLYYLIAIAEFVLAVWTLVLTVVGLSEVQGFSIGRAIGNLVLATLAFVVPLVIILYFVAKLIL